MNLATQRTGCHARFVNGNFKEVVMNSIIALLCALGLGMSSIAFAGPSDPQQTKPAVDCKKNPTHPDCKAKK